MEEPRGVRTVNFLLINGLVGEAVTAKLLGSLLGGTKRLVQEVGLGEQNIIILAGRPPRRALVVVLARGQLGDAQDGGVGIVLVHDDGGGVGRRSRRRGQVESECGLSGLEITFGICNSSTNLGAGNWSVNFRRKALMANLTIVVPHLEIQYLPRGGTLVSQVTQPGTCGAMPLSAEASEHACRSTLLHGSLPRGALSSAAARPTFDGTCLCCPSAIKKASPMDDLHMRYRFRDGLRSEMLMQVGTELPLPVPAFHPP
jgi:hypothetical protein